MESNNSTATAGLASTLCQKPLWYPAVGQQLSITVLYLGIPHFILVVGGQCLNFWAFRRQAKSEVAFTYQTFVSACHMLQCVSFLCLQYTSLLAGVGYTGQKWFMGSYVLMFYKAHLAGPLCHGIGMTTLLLSVSTVADRVFIFIKPTVYKTINHKKHRIIALLITLTIGYSATAYNVLLDKPVPSSDYGYIIQPETSYVTSPVAIYLAFVSNAVRMLGLTALVSGNIALVRFYKRRMKKVFQMTISSENGQKEAKNKALERTLVILAVTQSLFKGIRNSVSASYYIVTYAIPTFRSCDGVVFTPISNVVIMMCDMCDVCAIVCVNIKTREVIMHIFKRVKDYVEKKSAPSLPPQ